MRWTEERGESRGGRAESEKGKEARETSEMNGGEQRGTEGRR